MSSTSQQRPRQRTHEIRLLAGAGQRALRNCARHIGISDAHRKQHVVLPEHRSRALSRAYTLNPTALVGAVTAADRHQISVRNRDR